MKELEHRFAEVRRLLVDMEKHLAELEAGFKAMGEPKAPGVHILEPFDFTKIRHDINGNPRYTLPAALLCANEVKALEIARPLGGKRYWGHVERTTIVFSTYSLGSLCRELNEANQEAAKHEKHTS